MTRRHVVHLRTTFSADVIAALSRRLGRRVCVRDVRAWLSSVVDDELEHLRAASDADLVPVLEMSIAAAKRARRSKRKEATS